MSTRLEEETREALLTGTEHLSAATDPYARVMETVAIRRRRRHRVVAWVGAAVLALAVAVGLDARLDGVADRSTPVTEEPPPQQTPGWGLPSGWPARGELGTDPEFAGEFGRVLGTEHHLIYAEDGSAGRVIVAVSSAQEVVVFHGRQGAALDALERAPGLLAESRNVAVAIPQEGGHLIISLMPDNLHDAQLSTASVARDGSVEREWHQMPVDGGVARAVTSEPVGVLRVRSPAGDGPLHVVVGGEGSTPAGTLTCGRCDSPWFAAEGLADFHAQAAAAVGVEPEDVASRLLVDVAIPALPGTRDPGEAAAGRVVGYVATLPSGGLLRATYLVSDGPERAVWVVEPLRPLPAGDDDRPVFIPPRIVGSALLVAPGSDRLTFSPRDDAPPLAEVITTDGVGTVAGSPRSLAEYTITSYTADGAVQGTWHGGILATADPFRLFNRDWTGGSS